MSGPSPRKASPFATNRTSCHDWACLLQTPLLTECHHQTPPPTEVYKLGTPLQVRQGERRKWHMIYHLSAPQGTSINDFISKEKHSLHYATMDDAIISLLKFSPGALMAKIDHKSTFRMVPVRQDDWELLGIHWQNQYYVDTVVYSAIAGHHLVMYYPV